MRFPPKTQSLRAIVKAAWMRLLWATGLLAFAKMWLRRHGAVVLSFHRILTTEGMTNTSCQAGILVSQRTFDSLLAYLNRRHFVIDLTEGRLPQRSRKLRVAVTFDDGWEDNVSIAFPIAARHGVPFTVFVCSGLMDRRMPFWPDRVVALVRSARAKNGGMDLLYRALVRSGHPSEAAILADRNGDCTDRLIESIKLLDAERRDALLEVLFASGIPDTFSDGTIDRTMSWDQAQQLANHGVTFGSHTSGHEILTRISAVRIDEELQLSKKEIESRLDKECLLFSYPNGDASPQARDAAARNGFALAFINSPGVWLEDGDTLLIPRINLCETKLVGRNGEFSPLLFEYSVIWRAFLSHARTRYL